MAEQTRAAVEDVQKAARAWDQDQLECRMYGHSWRPMSARRDHAVNLIKAVYECYRCGTERHQELNGRTGHVYAQWYVYGPDYLMKGLGRITGDGRDVLRLETITRTFNVKRGKLDPHSKATKEAIDTPSNVTPIAQAS